jgi:ankyrin repeat protein
MWIQAFKEIGSAMTLEEVIPLVDGRIVPEMNNEGHTPLIYSLQHHFDFDIIKYFITQHPSLVNFIPEKPGIVFLPLTIIIHEYKGDEQERLLEFFIANGAKTDKLLFHIFRNGISTIPINIIRFLLLHCDMENTNNYFLSMMLEEKANINEYFLLMVEDKTKFSDEIVLTLLPTFKSLSLSVDYCDRQFRCSIIMAALGRGLFLLEILLNETKNINCENRDGETALHLAAYENFYRNQEIPGTNNLPVILLLIQYGADVAVNGCRRTPLEVMSSKSRQQVEKVTICFKIISLFLFNRSSFQLIMKGAAIDFARILKKFLV